ncbi:hypothetical protein ACFL0P_00145 [Candidatus Omnitrophota bacterium]
MGDFIRVWREVDINDIAGHLLVVGVSSGDCYKCRELGINYSTAKACPGCRTDFKYIASRNREVKKIKTKRPDLIFIDFEDYNKLVSVAKAKNLFGLRNE